VIDFQEMAKVESMFIPSSLRRSEVHELARFIIVRLARDPGLGHAVFVGMRDQRASRDLEGTRETLYAPNGGVRPCNHTFHTLLPRGWAEQDGHRPAIPRTDLFRPTCQGCQGSSRPIRWEAARIRASLRELDDFRVLWHLFTQITDQTHQARLKGALRYSTELGIFFNKAPLHIFMQNI
jgi:hypothetical protein